MNAPATRLRALIDRALPALRAIDDAASARAPRPDAWCPREVVGHLCDSATNNHRRFVVAQGRGDLVFDGYDQDHWVRAQRYAEADWGALVTLWDALNSHLVHVIDAIERDDLERERIEHSLHHIAFAAHPEERPATLLWFVEDYVDHARHHLAALVPELASA